MKLPIATRVRISLYIFIKSKPSITKRQLWSITTNFCKNKNFVLICLYILGKRLQLGEGEFYSDVNFFIYKRIFLCFLYIIFISNHLFIHLSFVFKFIGLHFFFVETFYNINKKRECFISILQSFRQY